MHYAVRLSPSLQPPLPYIGIGLLGAAGERRPVRGRFESLSKFPLQAGCQGSLYVAAAPTTQKSGNWEEYATQVLQPEAWSETTINEIVCAVDGAAMPGVTRRGWHPPSAMSSNQSSHPSLSEGAGRNRTVHGVAGPSLRNARLVKCACICSASLLRQRPYVMAWQI